MLTPALASVVADCPDQASLLARWSVAKCARSLTLLRAGRRIRVTAGVRTLIGTSHVPSKTTTEYCTVAFL